ncbi:MAG TPA: pilus assembly protein CpaE [Rhizomicrobium sp.]|nr:pilus assembly protein CpaE [Rhizomicrobium sp.]
MNKNAPPERIEPYGAAAHERPVPRISIHAFCEFPDTGASLQRAGADRRLAKATLTVQLGGIGAAVEHYSAQVTPNLLIVETRLGGHEALAELDRLAEVCDPASKVVVIGRVNDVELYRELMRRGASEYLVAPLDPLHLIEVVSSLYADPQGRPIGRVIAFMGARGGVGSSTFCHNAGWCVAEEFHINTTIVDLDLPFGTVALDFNDEPGQSVADALTAPERLDDVLLERVLLKRGDYLSLFASPASLERDFEVSLEAYESVLDAVRQSSPCVLVDLPRHWAPWVKQTLIGADEIVLVASPELASLRNTKNLVEHLRHNRPNDVPPRLILNKVGMAKRPEIPVKDFAETVGIEPALVVSYDPLLFGQAANNGQMLAELGQKSPVVDGIRNLAGLITGRKIAAKAEAKSILSFLQAKKRA